MYCVTEDLSENLRSMNRHLTVAIWNYGEQGLADAETCQWDQDQE